MRYQQPLQRCTVRLGDERSPASPTLDVAFDEPLRHVAEQQALVLYDGEVCLGAATIVSRGPSAYDVAYPNPVSKQQHQRLHVRGSATASAGRTGAHRLGT